MNAPAKSDSISLKHLQLLFRDFDGLDPGVLYSEHERFAQCAAEGLLYGRPAEVLNYQAMLRAGFAVATTRGMSATLLASASHVWSARLDATRRLDIKENAEFERMRQAIEHDPDRFSFALTRYPCEQFESVLVAALALHEEHQAYELLNGVFRAIDVLKDELPALFELRNGWQKHGLLDRADDLRPRSYDEGASSRASGFVIDFNPALYAG